VARAHEDDRCAASALLGGAVMNGPDATERLLRGAAANRGTTLNEAGRTRLGAIADHVHSGSATYAELNEAQGLLYRAGNTMDPMDEAVDLRSARRAIMDAGEARSGLTDADRSVLRTVGDRVLSATREADGAAASGRAGDRDPVNPVRLSPEEARALNTAMEHGGHTERYASDGGHLARAHGTTTSDDDSAFSDTEATGLARRTGIPSESRALGGAEALPELLRRGTGLDPGESATIRVRGSEHSAWADHFITVGRDSNGEAYVYNPDPAAGDRTLTHGSDAEVRRALAGYDRRTMASGDGTPPRFTIMHHHVD